MKIEDITMEDLKKSKEYVFIILAIVFLLSYLMIPFIGHGALIGSFVGLTSFVITIISFLLLLRLYGIKSKEGWVWLLFIIGLILLVLSRIADISGHTLAYFTLRLWSKPMLITGLSLKLNISGIDVNRNEKTLLVITFIGWWLLVILTSVIPVFYRGFDLQQDMFMVFASTEVFALMLACFIILSIKADGWFYFSVGVVMISMGDILHLPAEEYGLIYPGTPITLFWYIGLLLTAYGAYNLRQGYLKLMAL